MSYQQPDGMPPPPPNSAPPPPPPSSYSAPPAADQPTAAPSGPDSLPRTWTDPETGYSYYWDGHQWVPHETPQPNPAESTAPRERRKKRSSGGGSLKWFTAVATLAIVVVGLVYAISRGQDLERVSLTSGEVSFFGGDDGSAVTENDISKIEDEQDEIQRRLDELQAEAQEEAVASARADGESDIDPVDVVVEPDEPDPEPGVANFAGTWFGNNALTYTITQFGDQVVIEEQSAFGVTAVGEGTVVGDTAFFDYTAFDGSFGTAALTLFDTDEIRADFSSTSFGTQLTVFLSRF